MGALTGAAVGAYKASQFDEVKIIKGERERRERDGLSVLTTEQEAAHVKAIKLTFIGALASAGGAAGGNPAQLAHGISIALYNTAFGLIVAIPALIFWRYFRARVDGYLLTLELASEQLVRHLNHLRK